MRTAGTERGNLRLPVRIFSGGGSAGRRGRYCQTRTSMLVKALATQVLSNPEGIRACRRKRFLIVSRKMLAYQYPNATICLACPNRYATGAGRSSGFLLI